MASIFCAWRSASSICRRFLTSSATAFLERLVDPLQLLFGVPARRQLLLACFKEPRIVARECRLRCNTGHDPFVARGENPWLGVTKKQSDDHLARAGDHWYRQLGADGQVAMRH